MALPSLNVLAKNQVWEPTIFLYLQLLNKLYTLQNSPNHHHQWQILPMIITLPKHLKIFDHLYVFPFFHNKFLQFKFLFQIYNTYNNYSAIWRNNIKIIRMYMEVIQSFKRRWFKINMFLGICKKPITKWGLILKVWWKLWWGHGTLIDLKNLTKNKFHIKTTKIFSKSITSFHFF